jgi:RimJ/RimL family protein N-acetyltransferase
MVSWLQPVTLRGSHVTLEPLAPHHHDDLVDAVRDGELWKLAYTTIPLPEKMEAEIARRLALAHAGSMLPFAAIENASGKAVGMTTYMNIDAVHRRVEIGSTWYRTRVQRTRLNTECKLLLLAHAFETLDCIAVEFRTSLQNLRSQRAIERLGAQRDGILRHHAVHGDGTLRDTVVYSIIAAEWPSVRLRLQDLLARSRSDMADP